MGEMYMYLLFLLAIVACHAVLSIQSMRGTKRLLDTPITEKIKVKNYLVTITVGYSFLLVVLVMSLVAGISFTDIGLRGMSFDYNIWFTIITLVLCGVVFAICFGLLIMNIFSAKHRKRIAEEIAADNSNSNKRKVVAIPPPLSKKEKILSSFVAVSTGTTEEVIWRGFMFFSIQMVFPHLSIIFIVLITSVLFGIGHANQGIAGVIQTTLMGALFGCLFLATGSLIPGILLHFIVNFHPVFMANENDYIVQRNNVDA